MQVKNALVSGTAVALSFMLISPLLAANSALTPAQAGHRCIAEARSKAGQSKVTVSYDNDKTNELLYLTGRPEQQRAMQEVVANLRQCLKIAFSEEHNNDYRSNKTNSVWHSTWYQDAGKTFWCEARDVIVDEMNREKRVTSARCSRR